MAANRAAMWDQPSGWRLVAQKQQNPPERRAVHTGRGREISVLANLFSPKSPSFASVFLPWANLCRFPAASGGLLRNLTEILMSEIAILPNRYSRRREKIFGRGRCQPLDRNAKARITVYARAWSARHKQPGQHRGPLTRATLEVLEALLWGFHNSRDGRCFPSYEAIAKRAQCCRDTVYEAIRALEAAEILTWVNRLIRVQFREKDMFGNMALRTRLIRTSNAYVFRDPLPCATHPRDRGWGEADSSALSSKSENPPGTQTQDFNSLSKGAEEQHTVTPTPSNGLDQALRRLQNAMRIETTTA
jgi:hypothetical protein